MYYGYHFFGMHMVWWFLWILFIAIMFGAYEPVRRSGRRKEDLSLPQASGTPKGRVK